MKLKPSQIHSDDKVYTNSYSKFQHIIFNKLDFKYFEYNGEILEINKKRTAYIPVVVEIVKQSDL